jgi:hypothetical protein
MRSKIFWPKIIFGILLSRRKFANHCFGERQNNRLSQKKCYKAANGVSINYSINLMRKGSPGVRVITISGVSQQAFHETHEN